MSRRCRPIPSSHLPQSRHMWPYSRKIGNRSVGRRWSKQSTLARFAHHQQLCPAYQDPSQRRARHPDSTRGLIRRKLDIVSGRRHWCDPAHPPALLARHTRVQWIRADGIATAATAAPRQALFAKAQNRARSAPMEPTARVRALCWLHMAVRSKIRRVAPFVGHHRCHTRPYLPKWENESSPESTPTERVICICLLHQIETHVTTEPNPSHWPTGHHSGSAQGHFRRKPKTESGRRQHSEYFKPDGLAGDPWPW